MLPDAVPQRLSPPFAAMVMAGSGTHGAPLTSGTNGLTPRPPWAAWRMWSTALWLVAAGTIPACAHADAAPESRPVSNLVAEEFKVPSDVGIDIFVRNKHASTMTAFSAERTVVYIHGATGPSESDFDLSLGGFSWMEFIADAGYDVYLMDVRGYGRSTRPPQMSLPP